jgi:phosphoglycerate dehydrogenase-like enzyme
MLIASIERKVRVYVKNGSGIPEFFKITQRLFESIAADFPAARERIEVRIEDGEAGLEEGLGWADVLFTYRFPTAGLRRRAPGLRWIQLTGAGLDHLLPLDWLPSDIALTTASGAHRPAVDEFVTAAILSLSNRFTEMMSNQHRRQWELAHSSVVGGRTALMVGVGGIGGAAAEACKLLGMRTVGVRPSGRPHPFVDVMHSVEQLAEVLPSADFVVVAVPKTPDTLMMLHQGHLRRFKRGAYLVSFARSGIVDEMALVNLLEVGHIAGAVLDVENPKDVPFDDRLWGAPNLLIVPHCGTNDPATYTPQTVRIFFRNLERYLAGEVLANRVEPARCY